MNTDNHSTPDRSIPVRAGQICRSHPPHAQPRLFFVTDYEPRTGRPDIVRARLLTPDLELATGTEEYLPANPAQQRPYDLLVHEFPLYLYRRHVSPLGLTWRRAGTKSEYLRRYSDLAPLPARLASPPPLPGSPRWQWKLDELATAQAHNMPLCCLLDECEPPCL